MSSSSSSSSSSPVSQNSEFPFTTSNIRNGVFRLQGTNLFLTYPQCSVLPVDAIHAFKTKLKNYEWSIVAKETHDDGNPHLHAFVRLSKPCSIATPTYLDLLGTGGVLSHGNYQVARTPKACIDYVVKGGDFQCDNITLERARDQFTSAGRKRTATELIMQELDEGKDITFIARDHPEHMTFIMLHADRLQKFHTMSLLAKEKPSKTFVSAQAVFGQSQAWDLSIANWLNSNLFKNGRPLGTPQLWIQGPTGCGKTTLVMKLAECCRIYFVPDEDFYDEYSDANYDLIVFEEFKHQKTIQWMNKFCDGQVCPIRQKGHQAVKRKNHPIIVLSNLSMREAYPNVPDHIFNSISRRFLQISTGDKLRVELTLTDNIENGATADHE